MAIATVFDDAIRFGFESAFGTTPVDGYLLSVVSFTPTVTKNQTNTPEINGLIVDGKPTSGFRSVEMELVVRVREIATGWLFKGLFGVPTTTGVGPYTHTFTPDAATAIPSLSFEHELGTGDFYLASGAEISSMTMTAGGDGDLQITFSIMGADFSRAATSAFTGTVTDLTTETDLFNNFDASITNAANPTIDQFTVNINRAVEMYQELDGTPTASLSIGGKFVADGTIQMLFENDTILDKARQNTADAFDGVLTSGTSSLTFNFPTIVWDENAPSADAGTVKKQVTPKFTQYGTFNVELINGQASYA